MFSYVVAGWPGTLYQKIGALAAGNAVAVVLSLDFLLRRSAEVNTAALIAAYFVAAIPFLLSGTVVSLVIADTIGRVNRVYFFDLVGAAGGCAVLVFLLNSVGGPNTILIAAVLFAVSAAIWFHLAGSAQGRVAAVLLGLLLVGLITLNAKYHLIDVKFAKGQRLTNEEFVKWNSFSRIALKVEPDGAQVIIIDGDANTYLAQLDLKHLTPKQKFDLPYHGPGFPYLLRPGAKALIIGPGGGWDVARALASGSKDVTGRRDQSDHRERDHAEALSAIQQLSVFQAGSEDRGRGWAFVCAPLAGALPGIAGNAGGYLGFDRGRRVCFIRE